MDLRYGRGFVSDTDFEGVCPAGDGDPLPGPDAVARVEVPPGQLLSVGAHGSGVEVVLSLGCGEPDAAGACTDRGDRLAVHLNDTDVVQEVFLYVEQTDRAGNEVVLDVSVDSVAEVDLPRRCDEASSAPPLAAGRYVVRLSDDPDLTDPLWSERFLPVEIPPGEALTLTPRASTVAVVEGCEAREIPGDDVVLANDEEEARRVVVSLEGTSVEGLQAFEIAFGPPPPRIIDGDTCDDALQMTPLGAGQHFFAAEGLRADLEGCAVSAGDRIVPVTVPPGARAEASSSREGSASAIVGWFEACEAGLACPATLDATFDNPSGAPVVAYLAVVPLREQLEVGVRIRMVPVGAPDRELDPPVPEGAALALAPTCEDALERPVAADGWVTGRLPDDEREGFLAVDIPEGHRLTLRGAEGIDGWWADLYVDCDEPAIRSTLLPTHREAPITWLTGAGPRSAALRLRGTGDFAVWVDRRPSTRIVAETCAEAGGLPAHTTVGRAAFHARAGRADDDLAETCRPDGAKAPGGEVLLPIDVPAYTELRYAVLEGTAEVFTLASCADPWSCYTGPTPGSWMNVHATPERRLLVVDSDARSDQQLLDVDLVPRDPAPAGRTCAEAATLAPLTTGHHALFGDLSALRDDLSPAAQRCRPRRRGHDGYVPVRLGPGEALRVQASTDVWLQEGCGFCGDRYSRGDLLVSNRGDAPEIWFLVLDSLAGGGIFTLDVGIGPPEDLAR